MTEKEVKLVCGLVEKILDKHKMSPFTRGQLGRELTDTLTSVLLDEKSLSQEDDINLGDTVEIIDSDSDLDSQFIGNVGVVQDKFTMVRLVVIGKGASIVMRPKYIRKVENK